MQVYDMAPQGIRFVLWLSLAATVLVGVFLAFSLRMPAFEVSGEALRIRKNVFGRDIPIRDLRLDQARVVDLTREPDLAPRWRTMGVGLPWFQAGWFRLRDGGKALVFLGRSRDAVYIPTGDGYALLLAPSDPAALLRALQLHANGQGKA